MEGANSTHEFIEHLRSELPRLLRDDIEVRGHIIALLSDYLTTRQETAAILTELRQMRDAFERRMDEQGQRIDNLGQRVDEQGQRINNLGQRVDEQGQRIDNLGQRIDGLGQRIEDQGQRIEEQGQRIGEHGQRIDKHGRKLDEHTRLLGAIGARWGIMTEAAFHRSVAALFADQPDVHVEHWRHRDAAGKVFGYATDIDMDIVVRNGTLVLMEIKSSISGADVSEFKRRVDLYQEVTGRTPWRLLMIGPYVDDRAREVGERLGIELVSGVTPPLI